MELWKQTIVLASDEILKRRSYKSQAITADSLRNPRLSILLYFQWLAHKPSSSVPTPCSSHLFYFRELVLQPQDMHRILRRFVSVRRHALVDEGSLWQVVKTIG